MLISLYIASAWAAARENVVLRSGDVTVTEADFFAAILSVPALERDQFRASGERVKKVLLELLTDKVMASEARRLGIRNEAETRLRLQHSADRLLRKVLAERLAEESMAGKDLAATAEERYLVNRDKFAFPESRAVSHILISVKGRSDEDALKLASELTRQLELDPGRFSELAKAHSDDPGSRETGGKLGEVSPGRFLPEFVDATIALQQVGDISAAPISTPYGYHLIRLDSITPAGIKPFEMVKGPLIETLKTQLQAEAQKAQNAKLMPPESIEIDDAVYQALIRRFDEPDQASPEFHNPH